MKALLYCCNQAVETCWCGVANHQHRAALSETNYIESQNSWVMTNNSFWTAENHISHEYTRKSVSKINLIERVTPSERLQSSGPQCLFLGDEALLQCSAAVQLLYTCCCQRAAGGVLLGRLSTLDHLLQLVIPTHCHCLAVRPRLDGGCLQTS